MPEELKPCPFCESTKIRAVTKRTKSGYFGDGNPAYHVTAYATCGKCHARGKVVNTPRIPSSNTYGLDMFSKDYYFERRKHVEAEYAELEQRAITAWNTRT